MSRLLAAVGTVALAGLVVFTPGAAGGSPRPDCGSARVLPNQWVSLPGVPTPPALRGAGAFDGAPCAFIVVDGSGLVSTTWDTGRHWMRRTTLPLGPPTSSAPAGCAAQVNGVLTENLPTGSAYVFGAPNDAARCAAPGAPAAGLTSGMYETSDFGATFAPVPAFDGLDVLSVSAGPANPSFLAAVVEASPLAPRNAGSVIYTSADAGRTWNLAPSSAVSLPFLVAVGAGSPDSLWVGANADGHTTVTANPLEQAVWHSGDGGSSFQQVDDEASVNDASVQDGPAASDQVDIATGNGIAETADGGTSWRRLSAGEEFSAVRAGRGPVRTMMAVSEGVPVISSDGGVTFGQTAGLGYLGSACKVRLTRDAESPSLFLLFSVGQPIQGNIFGTCDRQGLWVFREGATAASGTQSSSDVQGSSCTDSGTFSPTPTVAPPATLPGDIPAPVGTVIYVDNFDGTCLVRFDRFGNATPMTRTPPASEGMALDFSRNLVLATRWSGQLLSIEGASGGTTVSDPRAYPSEGPSFDRWGNLFVTLNDNFASNGVYEYPFAATTGSLGRRLVWSFGHHFVEDTRIAPPRSPFAGDLFVLYASSTSDTAPDAVARLHRTAAGWLREPDFIPHVPGSVQALGMAFGPDGSMLLPDYRGSGVVLRYSPDGRRQTVFATVSSPGGPSDPFHSGGYAFNKIDVAANGYVYITSNNLAGSGVYEAQNALVRLDPHGRHLLPDFVSRLSTPEGLAVPNVITGLPQLPGLPSAVVTPPRHLVRGIAAPPPPPANGPPVSVTGPAPQPVPGLGPAPQAAQQANPVSQSQPVPQAGVVVERQLAPQLATVHVPTAEYQMSAAYRPRRAPDTDMVLGGLLAGGVVLLGCSNLLRNRERPQPAWAPPATPRPRSRRRRRRD